MNPCDLSAIKKQKKFVQDAINFYQEQIAYQQNLLQQMQPTWGPLNSSRQELATFYEKNIQYIRGVMSQYQKILNNLQVMWNVYSARQIGN